MNETSFKCSKDGLREFNYLRSAHAFKEKMNITPDEFFKLLMGNWREKHEQV